jgi:uncharacterized protein YciI
MARLFAVINERGPAWDHARRMEDQTRWREHADFMNALHAEGFALFAGPLEGTEEVLLILRAEDEAAVARRLGEDCWLRSGHLRLGRIHPWQVRLGSFD